MVAQKAEKADTKKERGDGPMIVTYADKAGKTDLKRANTDVVGVVIMQRAGNKSKSFDVSKLPSNVKDALAAMAFAQRTKTQVANNDDDGNNVISIADAMWKDLAEGKIYSKSADGTGPGRKFDPTVYAEGMRIATANMAKKGVINTKTKKVVVPMNDKNVADFKAKLLAMAPKERGDFIRGLKKNGFIAAGFAQADAEAKNKAVEQDDMEVDF